jgi:hypothetical protein
MIAAFISDEKYLTLPGIAVEFFDLATGKSTCFMSPASGVLLRADLGHGSYRVDLALDGTPRKRIESSLFSNQNKSRIPRNMIELISERPENTRRTHDTANSLPAVQEQWVRCSATGSRILYRTNEGEN